MHHQAYKTDSVSLRLDLSDIPSQADESLEYQTDDSGRLRDKDMAQVDV